ncbi:zinc transporter ZntB, partial [Vibrio sp. V17_P4S1T151]
MEFLIDQWHFSASAPQQKLNSASLIESGNWYHCQRDIPGLKEWLLQYQIPTSIVDSLLAEDTRPLFEQYDDDNFL